MRNALSHREPRLTAELAVHCAHECNGLITRAFDTDPDHRAEEACKGHKTESETMSSLP